MHDDAPQRRGSADPTLVVAPEELIPLGHSLGRQREIPGSQMFEIRRALSVFQERAPDQQIVDASQGDGGVSLPGVPAEVLEAAFELQCQRGTGYDGPAGAEAFRRSVVEQHWRLEPDTGWGPANVIACQGGRDALLRAYEAALHLGHGRLGELVLVSRVPWISYSWGPYAVGANVMLAPGDENEAWTITPGAVRHCVDEAPRRHEGRRIAALVVTSPDNPTGRTMPLERQIELVRAALAAGVPFVILDWIYHHLQSAGPNDINRFLMALEPEQRQRCIILDGITKSLGASNIRNAHLLASEPVVRFIASRASHGVIPSFYSQAVAIAAYELGLEIAARPIIEPTAASRAIVSRFVADRSLTAILGDGYYVFIDVGPWLDGSGLESAAPLARILAEHLGLAVVPGGCFAPAGDRWIRFSYALQPETTRLALQRLWSGLSQLETLVRL